MNQTYYPLSEICRSAIIMNLETQEVWTYPSIDYQPVVGFGPGNPPTHSYLVYWPGGLFAYVVCKYTLEQLSPNYIESAHASAKLLKPHTAQRKLRA